MPKTDCTFASSVRPRRQTATRSTSERDFRTGRWLATAHQPAPTTPTRNLPLMRILRSLSVIVENPFSPCGRRWREAPDEGSGRHARYNANEGYCSYKPNSLATARSRRLSAPTPHPALRATFPRKGGRARPARACSSVTPRLVFGDHHGGDQQHALGDHLIERRHARQDHAVVEHPDDEHAEHASDDRPFAAGQ